jgi:1-pyrroline-5-carboxylate dehydrogenase
MILPRVTYTNIGEDFSGVHAHLDALIPQLEASLLGRRHAALIGGHERSEGAVAAISSPVDRELVLGEFPAASAALVDQAVAAARASFPAWRDMSWRDRIATLRAGADALMAVKYEVSVACLIEVGKSRLEAVGEVEEAIDLIRYYCDEMERNDGYAIERTRAVAREKSQVVLRPYGVFAVISPFNFPVALSLGMITAALVAGNTVVFKPSEASSLTGRLLVDCLQSGGLPNGVLNLVFGGRDTGESLVQSEAVDGFAFTGSNAVGMAILRAAAARRANRPVLAEMGGKNAAFVTVTADLDVAATGAMRSAFGLQGQKCSALSKIYVASAVYDAFLERLIALTEKIVIGDPRQSGTFMGPVINAGAMTRFADAVELTRTDGRLLQGGRRMSGAPFDKGSYVEPTIVDGLIPDHRLNRDELFLPFLSVLRFDDLKVAIADANRSHYGLAAGIYTQDATDLDGFLNTIEAGVLYSNRASGATTGAWPGIQTFCGWKGSGVSGKGGLGTWYVSQFMREQSHTLGQRCPSAGKGAGSERLGMFKGGFKSF